ncbi:hypothetical protein Q5M85_16655 [Paraclostridium bifermentans]|nr:hypothetical protein [Paraclostridium bifermentans]
MYAVNNVSATSIQIGETAIYNIEILNSGKLDSLSTLLTTVFPPQLQVTEIKLDGNIISGDLVAGISLGPILSGKNKNSFYNS